MTEQSKATRIRLGDFHTAPMRAFHVTWASFLMCFVGWFAAAPLMPVIRRDLKLSPEQVGNIVIASVGATILARLLVGRLCDRFGPRLCYAWLLALGALPVMGLGLCSSYESVLLCRLAIGAVGASFVITQYHTSAMFAANCVGTANAMAAGWGNMGGGIAQMVMPLLMAAFLFLGVGESAAWRLALVIPGLLMLVGSVAYLRLTQDTPAGNFAQLQRAGSTAVKKGRPEWIAVIKDLRVWVLFLAYALCFGVELTIHNVAALYFSDRFSLSLQQAGLAAGLFGFMAIFARALGGYCGDRAGRHSGLRGRTNFLSAILGAQGLALLLFSRTGNLAAAIGMLVVFALFVHMACGATYAVLPFVNRRALGIVIGIVGAGGNVGAVAAGFLFRGALPFEQSFLILGLAVLAGAAVCMLAIRFSEAEELGHREAILQSGAITVPAS